MSKKTARLLYNIWLAALAVLLAAFSLQLKPVMVSGLGYVRSTCFMLFVMADVLCVLMLVSDAAMPGCHNSNVMTTDSSEEKPDPGHSRVSLSLRRLAAFALTTFLYWCFCFPLDRMFSTNSTIDALVAGGLLCAAAVFSR